MFKSKKTYIKRYASKNTDKKIRFSSGVKAGFGSLPKTNTPVKKGGSLAATEKSHSSGTAYPRNPLTIPNGKADKNAPYKAENARTPVMSGSVTAKPAPVEKPNLSGVKAEKNVRPIVDGSSDTRYTEQRQESAQTVSTAARSAGKTSAEAKADGSGTPTLQINRVEKKSETEMTDSAGKAAALKTKDGKKRKTKQKKMHASASAHGQKKAAHIASAAAKIAILIIIIGLCGFYGYGYISDRNEQARLLNESLNVRYAPEDYVYPQTPQETADKVKAAHDEAYRKAQQNAYVPARGEVPNLFNYDYIKTCYLTFDDGPSGEITESILNTLKAYDVKATFFVVGKNAEAYPELIRRMVEEGHSVGNHSYSHNYEYMYAGDLEFDEELINCKNTINNILGYQYNNLLFRFPGGSFEVYKKFYIYNIEAQGYQYVDWTALTGDSEEQDPDRDYIMNSLKESTVNGTKEDIVMLMHDAGAKKITADTLPEVIEYLKSKNYVFKAVTNSNFTPQ